MEPDLKSTRRIRGTTQAMDLAAVDLRQRMTPAERRLWQALRADRLSGLRFRRQHAIGPFVVDFYCAAHRLVIEVDGEVHLTQAEYDAVRSQQLNEYGYRVLRFTNQEIMHLLPNVLECIVRETRGKIRE
jgi:very-short-patch-repair endonuclease